MTDLFVIATFLVGIMQGIILCALYYAPDTPFWRSFFDAYTLRMFFRKNRTR